MSVFCINSRYLLSPHISGGCSLYIYYWEILQQQLTSLMPNIGLMLFCFRGAFFFFFFSSFFLISLQVIYMERQVYCFFKKKETPVPSKIFNSV